MSDADFDPAPIGDLRELIPHAGRMCLLEAVLAWDEQTIRCITHSHCDPCNPLRSGDRLAALHLCEYGAQAMAVHGGLLARLEHGGKAAPGMLASLREVEFAVDYIDDIDETLTVFALMKIAGTTGWLYQFEVSAGRRWLARGRVSVIRP
ncbi:MAG: phosphotransferase [Immundisolibacter sp.]|uniref:phosphotransferase n=1 Tax=Immundisolibacter sp. TaxID=1934948 RepID=UPI003EDF57BD